MSKFCKQCGAPLNPGATFCNKCGAPVNAGTPPTTPASGFDLSAKASLFNMGILISGIVQIISMFLPCLSVSFWGVTQSASMFKLLPELDFGILILLLLVAAPIAAIAGAFISKPILSLGAGVAGVIVCVATLAYISDKVGSLVDKGAGYYLLFLASIALAVFCVLSFLAARKK